jgi:hypothetical protein
MIFLREPRLDGKKKKEEGVNGEATSSQADSQQKAGYVRGIPDYDYQPGTIKFFRFAKPQQEKDVNIKQSRLKRELNLFCLGGHA